MIYLNLTPKETFYLAGVLRHFTQEHEPRVSRDFLLKFGFILLKHVGADGSMAGDEQPLEVSEEELLALRELIPFGAKMGSVLVGVGLHYKIYEQLLALHPEQAMDLDELLGKGVDDDDTDENETSG